MVTMPKKCSSPRSDGQPCQSYPIDGADVCHKHGGRVPQVARVALVRAEVARWKLPDSTDDPGEVLLRLLTQSRRRADMYAGMLGEAYEAAELDDIVGTPIGSPGNQWKMPPGVKALIGHKYALDPLGGPAVPIAEAIRGLVDLEGIERDRCANFATKAIAAGLAERTVRIQESQAAQAQAALMAGLDYAGITGDTRNRIIEGVVAALHLNSVEARHSLIVIDP